MISQRPDPQQLLGHHLEVLLVLLRQVRVKKVMMFVQIGEHLEGLEARRRVRRSSEKARRVKEWIC